MDAGLRFLDILKVLVRHDVDFILDPAGRHLVPDEGRIASMRLHRLITDHGPLDVMKSIGDGLTYDGLSAETREYEVSGLPVRVLKPEKIILSKEQVNRDKDRSTLHTLRRTLRLRSESE